MRHIELWMLEHGSRLGLGTTAVLVVGCAAVCLTRSPLRRQRICEGSFAAVVAWIALYFSPMSLWFPALPGFERIAVLMRSDTLPSADLTPVESNDSSVRKELSREISTSLDSGTILQNGMKRPESIQNNRTHSWLNDPMLMSQQVETVTFSWPEKFALIYVVGASIVLGSLLRGRLTLSRWMRKSATPPDWLKNLLVENECNCDSASKKSRDPLSMAQGNPTNLRVSPDCGRPICFGVTRPTILLPIAMVNPGMCSELSHVLRHEMAHVRHRDSLGRLLANSLLPLCYLHPIYWILRKTMNESAECRADDYAARQSDPVAYVAAITQLARSFPPRPAVAFATAGILGSKSSFYRRMNMLLSSKSALERTTPFWWKLTSIGVATTTLLASASALQEPASKPDSTTSSPATSTNSVEKTTPKLRPAEVQVAVDNAFRPTKAADPTNVPPEHLLQMMQNDRATLESQLLKAMVDLAAWKTKLGDNHPEIVALQKRIEQLTVLRQVVAKRIEEAIAPHSVSTASSNRRQVSGVQPIEALPATQANLPLLSEMRALQSARDADLAKLELLQSKLARLDPLGELPQKASSSGIAKSADGWPRSDQLREIANADAASTRAVEAKKLQDLLGHQNLQLKQAQAELLAVRDELARQQNLVRETAPTSQTGLPKMATIGNAPSLAMLRHELRMAKANVDILRTEAEAQKVELSIAKNLVDKKQMSADQFRVKEVGLMNAEARLRRAYVEIESLAEVIKETESERQRLDPTKPTQATR